jgi:hypothetical protein
MGEPIGFLKVRSHADVVVEGQPVRVFQVQSRPVFAVSDANVVTESSTGWAQTRASWLGQNQLGGLSSRWMPNCVWLPSA